MYGWSMGGYPWEVWWLAFGTSRVRGVSCLGISPDSRQAEAMMRL